MLRTRNKAMSTIRRKRAPTLLHGANRQQDKGNISVGRKIEDKLSNLPDKLLQHILSFLDTKVAVQTSVLCRRWIYLWQGLSALHFNSHSFASHASFMGFVRHVLFHRDLSKSLREFTIYYRRKNSNLKEIIDYLVSHGRDIQVLKFCAFGDPQFLPPFLPLLLTWESLRILKLEDLVIPDNLHFDFVSLVTLHLKNCQLPWNKSDACDPFKGYLKLKILRLNGLTTSLDVKTLVISAPELTDLKISWMGIVGLEPHYKIVLSSLKLKSFSFKGPQVFEFSIKCLPFLEKVNVHVGQKFPTAEDSSTENDRKYLVIMLQGLSNAKSFSLSHETISVLSKAPDVVQGHRSPLTSVADIKIKVRFGASFYFIPSFALPLSVINYLLSGSPSAKSLVIEHSNVQDQKSSFLCSSF